MKQKQPEFSLRAPPLTERDYDFIRKAVYDYCRINLGPNKRELVKARLSKRLRILNLPDYLAYLEFLKTHAGKEEWNHLIDAISTNHTFFFRESAHFEFMVDVALPELNKKGKPFRVWSAACSSGEEPFSIAILLNEYFNALKSGNFSIECTDISTRVLKKAQEGIFPEERVDRIRRDWLSKYFQAGKGQMQGHYRIHPGLTRAMKFTHLNLMDAAYPFKQSFDIIFCRNVMIYFDRHTQEDLVNRMCKFLIPGGYLFIGHSESLTGMNVPVKLVKPAIYRKP